MDYITELFCILDDFCKKFNESLEKALISDQKTRLKKSALSLSEVMTIVILFHKSGFRFFKYFKLKEKIQGSVLLIQLNWSFAIIFELKAEALAARGLKLLTPSRKNMKNRSIQSEEEKQLLCKRGLIETVNDQLKNLHQLEHSRHRSVNNFMVNIMAAVVAYCLNPNKPTFPNS